MCYTEPKVGNEYRKNVESGANVAVNVEEELWKLADEGYREFHGSLIPGNQLPIIGVRTPLLRKMAKELIKGDWRDFLQNGKEDHYEEVILKALATGTAPMDKEERFQRIREFIPRITNWAVCDIFCGSLRFAEKYRDEVWEFIKPYMESDKEYEIRFGAVMALDHFADKDHAKEAFQYFDRIRHDGYYVKMAVAWAISIYFIKVPDLTMEYLKDNRLDDWTYNKALQKITESFRVEKSVKEQIKSMKRKQRV